MAAYYYPYDYYTSYGDAYKNPFYQPESKDNRRSGRSLTTGMREWDWDARSWSPYDPYWTLHGTSHDKNKRKYKSSTYFKDPDIEQGYPLYYPAGFEAYRGLSRGSTSSGSSPRSLRSALRYEYSPPKAPRDLKFSLLSYLATELLNPPVSFSFRSPIPSELAYTLSSIPAFSSPTSRFDDCRIHIGLEDFPKEWRIKIRNESGRPLFVYDLLSSIWESLHQPVFDRSLPRSVDDARRWRMDKDPYADGTPRRVDWLKRNHYFHGMEDSLVNRGNLKLLLGPSRSY